MGLAFYYHVLFVLCVLATMPHLIHLYTSMHLNFKPSLVKILVGYF